MAKEKEVTSKALDFNQTLDSVGEKDFKSGLQSVLPGQAKKAQMLTAGSSSSAGSGSQSSGSKGGVPGQANKEQQGATDADTYKTAYNAMKNAVNSVNNECTKADMNDTVLKSLVSQPGPSGLATAYQAEIARLKPLLQEQSNKAMEALAFFQMSCQKTQTRRSSKLLLGSCSN